MIITAAQIRAARGLLGWKPKELAYKAGLSDRTIRNIESGVIKPHGVTAVKIYNAFENAGVVFSAEGGIRPTMPEVKPIEGEECIDFLFDDLLSSVARGREDIIGTFASQEAILQAFGLKRQDAETRLKQLGKHVLAKWGLPDSDKAPRHTGIGEIRTLSKYCIPPGGRIIYGNKFITLQNIGQSDRRIIVVKDPNVASTMKSYFYELWNIAVPFSPLTIKSDEQSLNI